MAETTSWYNPLEYSINPMRRNHGISSLHELTAYSDSGDEMATAELNRRRMVHEDAFLNWQNASQPKA